MAMVMVREVSTPHWHCWFHMKRCRQDREPINIAKSVEKCTRELTRAETWNSWDCTQYGIDEGGLVKKNRIGYCGGRRLCAYGRGMIGMWRGRESVTGRMCGSGIIQTQCTLDFIQQARTTTLSLLVILLSLRPPIFHKRKVDIRVIE